MKNKWFSLFIIILTVVNLAALGTFVFKRWCSRPGQDTERHVHYLKKYLKLNEEQVEKVRNIHRDFKTKSQNLSNTLHLNKLELLQELKKENPEEEKIERLLSEMDTAQAGLQREVINQLRKEKDVFTLEQQEKFFNLVVDHGKRKHPRFFETTHLEK